MSTRATASPPTVRCENTHTWDDGTPYRCADDANWRVVPDPESGRDSAKLAYCDRCTDALVDEQLLEAVYEPI